jgi:hypothetical protein
VSRRGEKPANILFSFETKIHAVKIIQFICLIQNGVLHGIFLRADFGFDTEVKGVILEN